MTVTAINAIYDFRPSSKIPEERAAVRSAGANQKAEGQLDLFIQQTIRSEDAAPGGATISQSAEFSGGESVSGLLDEFFESRVQRYDADEDGRLNREEFYGSDELFARLDEDDDGLLSAPDLKRQFLANNPEMRDMAEGFANRLYDRILNSPDADQEGLTNTVNNFFGDFVNRHSREADGLIGQEDFPGTPEEFAGIAGEDGEAVGLDDLIDHFNNENPDLVELRESLLQLKEMARPQTVRPEHIDLFA